MSSKNGPERTSADATVHPAHRRSRVWSLAAGLTVWYALSSFILIFLAGCYLYWAAATNLDHDDDHFLADQMLPLVNLLRAPGVNPEAIRRQIELAWTSRPDPGVYFRVVGEHGQALAATPGMALVVAQSDFPAPQPFDRDTVQGKNFFPGPEHAFRAAHDPPFRLLAVLVDDKPSYIVQAAMDREHAEELLAGYRRDLGLVLGLAVVACSAVGYWLARRGIRPVQDIAAAAMNVSSSTLNERIPSARLPAELASLAARFNDMLERLESSFARLSQFAADLAHELRTPISNLRGTAEVALRQTRTPSEYQEVLGSALEEYERLSRLIDSLLFLARAEDPAAQIQRGPVDVGQELDCLREFYGPAAAEVGVCLTVACPENIVGHWDRTLLQRALGNLVANALQHTPAQGSITLSAAAQDGCCRIEVTDTGRGIAPEHRNRVFDRFFRVPGGNGEHQGHVGLGLAIVKKIAELHGGSVTIASAPGAGTRITLSLPMTKS